MLFQQQVMIIISPCMSMEKKHNCTYINDIWDIFQYFFLKNPTRQPYTQSLINGFILTQPAISPRVPALLLKDECTFKAYSTTFQALGEIPKIL